MKCQDITWFEEPGLKNEDECGLDARILVKGVVRAQHTKVARMGVCDGGGRGPGVCMFGA